MRARASLPVIVVGGGPGGSLCAARLAQLGQPVLLLEKATHPRFHLGESLLPTSMKALERAGLLGALHERFLVKRGACFHEDSTAKIARYDFADAYGCTYTYAFQVPRDEFDDLLFRHAAREGAEVREGWTVTGLCFERGRATGVTARDPAGAVHRLDAAFVIDASGREALGARAQRAVCRLPGLDKTALFSQWRGVAREADRREGDIQIVVFEHGWFWFIPFKDGRTSIGAVVSSDWMKTRASGEPVDALYRRTIGASKTASRLLTGAEQLWPAGATADFSFRVRALGGDGWLALGDSAGFIDPLFSTGAHLAMHGAMRAADEVARGLGEADVSSARFEPWRREMRVGADLFLGAVRAFYVGTLVPYLFAQKPHPFLRRSLTTMLAGDVFDPDARWAREMRARFPAER